MTPMMQQYTEVKRGLPAGTLLLFRLGDFFEMFNEDAAEGSRLLGLTLTKRQDAPMAGIPYHALDTYVNKLLAAGRKVAVCDQLEPPKPGKLVRRSLVRILSPGTTLAANQLDEVRNHYLAAIDLDHGALRAAWVDLSTGEFKVAADSNPGNLLPVLTALDPREVLMPEGARAAWRAAPHDQIVPHALEAFCSTRACTELPGYQFDTASGAQTVMKALGVLNLEGFGLDHSHPALGAAGALVDYASESLCARPENLRSLQEYRSARTLLIDPATLRNLEIFQSARGTRAGSLLAAIDRTVTAPGSRLLERWLAAPPLDLAEVRRRQAIVGELIAQPGPLAELHALQRNVRDIPRILSRLQNRLRSPRELGGIRDTLARLPEIIRALTDLANTPLAEAELAAAPSSPITTLVARIVDQPALRSLLDRALADELSADLLEGGYIRAGYDAEVDRLRGLTRDSKTWLSDLECQEQERTGIKSLKVRFNSVFGYYIEVTKANLHLVPADYIRRQTTVGGERYVTEALKEKEKEILHAEEKVVAREQALFAELVNAVIAAADPLRQAAEALAELDVLAGWAELAREWDFCRPELDESDVLEIVEGRHPIVEQMLKAADASPALGGQAFVPNDTLLDCRGPQILLVTGPNMAGKSTYIRQVALIALLAQIGCWTPAKKCHLGLVDRIFSRVGASDDLARGNSTFMVEMNETANILNHYTDRSLIILDEIGRGTSTYDGLSIAWAVVEHLHHEAECGPRTLFATHYQELTQLEKHLPRLRNCSVAVKEWNEEIVFVRRVVPGAADRSYGIQVARLAGLPLSVIDRAKLILGKLESDDTEVDLPAPAARPKKKLTVKPGDDGQLDLL